VANSVKYAYLSIHMPHKQSAYKKNYLTDVVVKINFPIILELSEGQPTAFQKEIQVDYPILEPLQEIEFKIENKGLSVLQHKSNRTLWRFRNRENTEYIELDYGSLAYIVKKYTDYTTFKRKAESIFNQFFKIYSNILITRLGLRYINKLDLGGTDYFNWSDYLNVNLIKKIDFYSDKTKIKRLITISELAPDEETVLNFKYGIFNSTYPSPVVKKEFILDYDCYTLIQFEKENIIAKIDTYHRYIKENFETSITTALREILNHE